MDKKHKINLENTVVKVFGAVQAHRVLATLIADEYEDHTYSLVTLPRTGYPCFIVMKWDGLYLAHDDDIKKAETVIDGDEIERMGGYPDLVGLVAVEMLSHIGRENRTTLELIRRKVNPTDKHLKPIHDALSTARVRYQIPIIADPTGTWIATDKAEVLHFAENHHNRAATLEQTGRDALNAWDRGPWGQIGRDK